ncbi:hypothetical protein BCR32DRAFT_243419 [Anaeromyces robustus]|uniref:Uncharacterized protein n=1 Tax=Anaeromyces robustus TaxID=1754192 RepID=A0A1Y1XCA6_9FUNG|nr:hypothetical protein BCR32DRAFT_243419 [Anaeromyces robustus]|eukprot:ORX83355.1 hypothetical protein BCR32DRAFT_243419 [Anaeromyces robustus]
MLKWGKSTLHGSSWKHRYSFSTSELELKFDKNKYRKIDNSFDLENFIEINESSIINDNNLSVKSNNNTEEEKKKWLSASIYSSSSEKSSYDSNGIDNNHRRSSVISEPIKERDVMEWKKYVKYEIKETDYLNLNIKYNLKYNSNYEVENIPEEIIMELLNNQLLSQEVESTNPTSIINNVNSKSSYFVTSTTTIPSPLIRASNLKNHNFKYNDSDTILKEDNSSFTSELTANVPQTISTDRPENNIWNSLYIYEY